MKAYQKQAFDDWAKEHLDVGDETRAGDEEAMLNAESGWEAGWQHAQGVIDRLIEAANKLSGQLETWAPHEYRPKCACYNCLAIGEFRGLLQSLNEP